MKQYITMSLLSLLATPNTWASLPEACENLAWKLASQQFEPEAYADIIDVIKLNDKIYTATVRASETCWYDMKSMYNEQLNQCYILKLEASYR